jgi:protein TonB
MSEAIAISGFDGVLDAVLRERVVVTAPTGLEQRLLARMAQESEPEVPVISGKFARPFAFAESVAARGSTRSLWLAVGVHAAAILVVMMLVAWPVQLAAPVQRAMVTALSAPLPKVAPRVERVGGGGGHPDASAVTQGRLPKLATTQIVAPKAPPMIAPKLAVEPSVVVQPDLKLATNAMPDLGAPNSSLKGISLGNGTGNGIGLGNGSGIGPGAGGNTGGGVFHVGGAVMAPRLIVQVDPEFSEEARKAKFSGNVEVYLVVDEQGLPTHVRVARGVGMGLDEKAVEAVRQYRFKPAMLHGKPVKVDMYVDVSFQIF